MIFHTSIEWDARDSSLRAKRRVTSTTIIATPLLTICVETLKQQFLHTHVRVRTVAATETATCPLTCSSAHRGASCPKIEGERHQSLHWSALQTREEYISQEAETLGTRIFFQGLCSISPGVRVQMRLTRYVLVTYINTLDNIY